MSVNLSQIALNLELGENGLWCARTGSKVSYPAEGNESCFAVEDSSFWFRHRNLCILEVLKAFPPSGTFFDIGGGNGYVARAIQDTGVDVVVVEPGFVGARNAKNRGIRQVVQATLADAHFLPETLPAVGLFDVVEHIEKDRAFFESLNRVLLPNARLYITVPAFQALWSHEDEDAGHWRRYSLQSLSRVLVQSGYSVEFATCFFGFLLVPIILARALPYRLGLRPKQTSRERIRADHQPGNRLAARAVRLLTERELRRIASGRRSNWGGSCLVVARKSGELKAG